MEFAAELLELKRGNLVKQEKWLAGMAILAS